MKKVFAIILIIMVLGVLCAGTLYLFFGVRPKTGAGWILLLTLGLPLTLLGECFGDFINRTKISKSIERMDVDKRISGKRIFWLVLFWGAILYQFH